MTFDGRRAPRGGKVDGALCIVGCGTYPVKSAGQPLAWVAAVCYHVFFNQS